MLAPDDVDDRTVPSRRQGLTDVSVGDELVVLGGLTGAQSLNPTASLVWRCLDGHVSIDELASELAETMPTDPGEVRADVVRFVRQLGEAGLLENVGHPAVHVEGASVEPDRGVAVIEPRTPATGDRLDEFSLLDADGSVVGSSDLRGSAVLLVNWSATCGFCVRIAPELASLVPQLEARHTSLVVVVGDEPGETRALFDRLGLHVRVLQRHEPDPFAGWGTPVAYLLDADGRLGAPMAIGAGEVPALARQAAGVTADEPADGVRYLPASGGTCGPTARRGGAGPRQATVTAWQGTRAFRFGDVHVGIRYGAEPSLELLEALFADAAVDDAQVPDNYGVALHRPRAGTRQLNLLLQGSTQLVRSRSAARVLWALLGRLSADLAPPDGELLAVRATTAVWGGRAVLLPGGVGSVAAELQPRLARLGVAVADAAGTGIDLSTGEVVVAAPSVPYDPEVLERADAGVALGRSELPYVTAGRYPLAAWIFPGPTGRTGWLSPGEALAAVLVLAPPVDVASTAARLAAVLPGVVALATDLRSAPQVARDVRSILDRLG